MKAHWTTLAGYNAWANERLYDAVASLPAGSFEQEGGAFFGSLRGTLNHLLVTDRIWMRRLTGEGEAPDRLDAVLFETFEPLRAARRAEDRRIIDWIERLSDDDLGGVFRYRRVTTPDVVEQPRADALAHLFNHQTHHRGQAHALVTRFGGREAGPVLDLLAFQRTIGAR
ncbi:damage-inducible protein DinB [Chelatococcus sambhunathii]|uniref:Damage-inducible protein DinB n=1 Tax=Chelatococcus sambhunathii TaxID=363953 RepID=A0ABU1DEW5_9HYPH|nr:DinB family protein [Chelatococcus sambhunathii]MDR4306657.1 damage-inducible protein DinB [Chelatococcus sambhunathii]